MTYLCQSKFTITMLEVRYLFDMQSITLLALCGQFRLNNTHVRFIRVILYIFITMKTQGK